MELVEQHIKESVAKPAEPQSHISDNKPAKPPAEPVADQLAEPHVRQQAREPDIRQQARQ